MASETLGVLHVYQNENDPKSLLKFPLREGENVVGASAYCDIKLKLQDIADHHCKITVSRDGEYTIEDSGSAAGVFQITGDQNRRQLKAFKEYELVPKKPISLANKYKCIFELVDPKKLLSDESKAQAESKKNGRMEIEEEKGSKGKGKRSLSKGKEEKEEGKNKKKSGKEEKEMTMSQGRSKSKDKKNKEDSKMEIETCAEDDDAKATKKKVVKNKKKEEETKSNKEDKKTERSKSRKSVDKENVDPKEESSQRGRKGKVEEEKKGKKEKEKEKAEESKKSSVKKGKSDEKETNEKRGRSMEKKAEKKDKKEGKKSSEKSESKKGSVPKEAPKKSKTKEKKEKKEKNKDAMEIEPQPKEVVKSLNGKRKADPDSLLKYEDKSTTAKKVKSEGKALPVSSAKKGKKEIKEDNHSSSTRSSVSKQSTDKSSPELKIFKPTKNAKIKGLTDLLPKRNACQVMFSGIDKDGGFEEVKRKLVLLGAKIVEEKEKNFSVLVMDKFKRTIKFLLALSKGVDIVSYDWVKDSVKAGKLLPFEDYAYVDKSAETQFKFKLATSLKKAKEGEKGLLEGQTVYLPTNLKPSVDDIKVLVESLGGNVLKTKPNTERENCLAILNEDDSKNIGSLNEAGVVSYSSELIYSTILHQKLNLNQNKLKV